MYCRTRWRQFSGHSSFLVCPKLPEWNIKGFTTCQEMTNCTFNSLSVPVLMQGLCPACDDLFCNIKNPNSKSDVNSLIVSSHLSFHSGSHSRSPSRRLHPKCPRKCGSAFSGFGKWQQNSISRTANEPRVE